MSKLKTKKDVVEKYWIEYLYHCIDGMAKPTVDGFWSWYLTSGPLGMKRKNLYYSGPLDKAEYV